MYVIYCLIVNMRERLCLGSSGEGAVGVCYLVRVQHKFNIINTEITFVSMIIQNKVSWFRNADLKKSKASNLLQQ